MATTRPTSRVISSTAIATRKAFPALLKEIQNYFRMANMQSKLKELDSWLCNRLRYCIWTDWKKPERKRKNLIRLGIPEGQAYAWSRTRMGNCPEPYHGNDYHVETIDAEGIRIDA